MTPSSRDAVREACAGTDFAKGRNAVAAFLEAEAGTAATNFAFTQSEKLAERIGMPRRRVAALSSFTLDLLTPHLALQRFLRGEWLDIRYWPYNQWYDALVNPGDLDDFDPEAVWILLHLEDVMPLLAKRHLAAAGSLADEREMFLGGLGDALRQFRDRSPTAIILSTFVAARRGIERFFDRGVTPSRVNGIEKLNHGVMELAAETENALVFDYAEAVIDFGRLGWFDPVKDHLTRSPVSSRAMPALAREFSAYVSALWEPRKKVIAVDLDNSLWGGVLGEDGVDGILASGNYPGNAHESFQSFLANARASGMLLAMVSKNNEPDARAAFDENPAMPLQWDSFSAHKVNWEDKATNLSTAAYDINVGIDSFVFADDSSLECALVGEHLDGVKVVELSGSPALFADKLMASGGLDAVALTAEDFERAGGYQTETHRKRERARSVDTRDFLTRLGLQLRFDRANGENLARVVQLFSKTNQFNLTTKRYDQQAVLDLMESDDHEIITLRVNDRFGDYGLVGVAVLTHDGCCTEVDSLLMSCRVLGRNVEDAFLTLIAEQARKRGSDCVIGLYVPTAKNGQVEDLYVRFGYRAEENDGRFVLDLDDACQLDYPGHIEIVNNVKSFYGTT